MISRRFILKAIAGSACALLAPRFARANAEPIRIGEINSYTPDLNLFTIPYRKGWTLRLEQVNQNGGINGRKIEVISRNDHGEPQQGMRIAKLLIEKSDVKLLFGTFLSDVGLSVATTADSLQTPFIAAEPLSDKLTLEKGNPYTFHIHPNTFILSNMLAKEAAKLPVNRWACIAPDDEYGRTAVKNFKTFMEVARPDVEWVYEESFPTFKIDAGKIVRTLSNHHIDAIFNASYSTDLEQLVSAGEKTNFFQGKSVISLLTGEPEHLSKLTSAVCDGWIVTGYPRDQIQTASHQTFVEAYKKRFAEPPMLGSLVGYTTFNAVIEALKQSPELTGPQLVTTLKNINFESPLGMLSFRSEDQQSSMGAFVGRLEHQKGQNKMVNWYYAGGENFAPSLSEIKHRRPTF